MITFRILSALLNYPTPELKAQTRAAAELVRREGILAGEHLDAVCGFLRHIETVPQLDAESDYIDSFDRGRSTSLHLFEHIHGESRDRGQAMVTLISRYRMHGLEMRSAELPDFLPLFLEFLSVCRPQQAKTYLAEVGDVIALIGERLHRRRSPYAGLLAAVASLAPQAAGEPAEAGGEERDDTPAALDAAWEETPVTFDDATLSSVERSPGRTACGPGAAVKDA